MDKAKSAYQFFLGHLGERGENSNLDSHQRLCIGGHFKKKLPTDRNISELLQIPSISLFKKDRILQVVTDAHPTAQQKIYLPTIIKAPAPGTLYATDDIVGNLRYVPAGTFAQGTPSMEVGRYGEEGPQFQHTLTKNLAVMETEVSQGMWAALKLEKGSLPDNPSYFKTNSNNPVESVTWYHAVFFANLLSESQGFTKVYYINPAFTTPINSSNYLTGPFYCNWEADGYRLPTEGEWECLRVQERPGRFRSSNRLTAYRLINHATQGR